MYGHTFNWATHTHIPRANVSQPLIPPICLWKGNAGKPQRHGANMRNFTQEHGIRDFG